MKSKLLAGAFAAALSFAFSAWSANAVTFDVTGSGINFGTLTGTMDGDAALTVINAINLQITGQPNPFNIIHSYVPNVLQADSNPSTFTANIALFFSPTDWDAYLAEQTSAENAAVSANAANADVAFILCGGDAACQAQVVANFIAGQTQISDTYGSEFAATVVAEIDATPLPAALPLFATGLGVIGLVARRRKCRSADVNRVAAWGDVS